MKATQVRNRRLALIIASCCALWQTVPLAASEPAPAPQLAQTRVEEPEAQSNADISSAQSGNRNTINREALVVFGKDVVLKTNETAQTVVVIGGSARIDGKVHDAVVAIGGNVTVNGEVGQAAVAVGGDVTASGKVGEEVVAVMGSVRLEPTAKVHGDVVSVGGTTDVAEGATVGGRIQDVSVGGFGLPKLAWLTKWLQECVFKFRPLAPSAGWLPWSVAGGFLVLYLLIALAFPGAVQACVSRLDNQPATTFLTGLLIKLLLPFVIGILAITGIGLIGVPFLVAAAFLAKLIGKAALMVYLGRQLTRPLMADGLQNRLGALLLGWVLITLLYMVPFLGLFTMVVASTWALGVATMAVISRSRREAPPRPTPLAPVPPASPTPTYFMPAVPPTADRDNAPGAGFPPQYASPLPASDPQRVPPTFASASRGYVPDSLLHPRGNFWRRMASGMLDLFVVWILSYVSARSFHAAVALEDTLLGRPFLTSWLGGGLWFPIWSVAYFTAMWAWKGTTIGGVVTSLRVVRLDGQPVSFAVALVRSLSAWFSGIILFLGFFWIAWDRDQQGWHDKIAGTVVVRLPRSVPLVCL